MKIMRLIRYVVKPLLVSQIRNHINVSKEVSLITFQAKKNSLCLRLAQLSEEEQSSPHSDALDEIWKDLKDLSPSFQSELEQQQKKEGEGETVMKSTPMTKDDSDKDEVSVVDLVAEAYLQGSITEVM